ncbi:CHAT domain-containing protein [bacterium]|nr:CHAT domain-containing protein [bacterium]
MFTNFDLHIRLGEDERPQVRVLASAAGESAHPIIMPNDPLALMEAFRILRQPTSAHLQALGRQLADALLPAGEVRDLYQRSLGMATASGGGLRLRLRVDPPELAAVPWEYAYDQTIDDFVVLNPQVALVRYLSQPVAPRSVTGVAPLPVLLFVGAPDGDVLLDSVGEIQHVLDALADLMPHRVTLEILFAGAGSERQAVVSLVAGRRGVHLSPEPATLTALRSALRRGVRVVHYTGHGYFDPEQGGALLVQDEEGGTESVDAHTMARQLRGSQVALAFLNGCNTAIDGTEQALMGLAPRLVAAGLPAVVAMQTEIDDRSAIRFAAEFYRSLADGLPLDASVGEGRKAVSRHLLAWGIPALFMRSADGQLWQETSTQPTQSRETAASPTGGIHFGDGVTVTARNIVVGNVTEITGNQIGHVGHEDGERTQKVAQLRRQLDALRTQLTARIDAGRFDEILGVQVQALLETAQRQTNTLTPNPVVVNRYIEQIGQLLEADEMLKTVVSGILETLTHLQRIA